MNEHSENPAAVPPAAEPAAPAAEPAAPEDTSAANSLDDWPLAHHQWNRVSPKYAFIAFISNLSGVLVVAIAWFVATEFEWLTPWLRNSLAIAAIIYEIVVALLAFRQVKALGYVLREDDILFRRGLMFQRIVAVPYGRLQVVDVHRGPLLRLFGLANLKFLTASVGTNLSLDGLPVAEADRVRDHLIQVAETRRSGL